MVNGHALCSPISFARGCDPCRPGTAVQWSARSEVRTNDLGVGGELEYAIFVPFFRLGCRSLADGAVPAPTGAGDGTATRPEGQARPIFW